MQCYYCKRKLNIFSDYKQKIIEGEKQVVCASCLKKEEKKEIQKLVQTTEGKKTVKLKGETFLGTGMLVFSVGIFVMCIFPSIFSVILIGIGTYSMYKGVSYIKLSKRNDGEKKRSRSAEN